MYCDRAPAYLPTITRDCDDMSGNQSRSVRVGSTKMRVGWANRTLEIGTIQVKIYGINLCCYVGMIDARLNAFRAHLLSIAVHMNLK